MARLSVAKAVSGFLFRVCVTCVLGACSSSLYAQMAAPATATGAPTATATQNAAQPQAAAPQQPAAKQPSSPQPPQPAQASPQQPDAAAPLDAADSQPFKLNVRANLVNLVFTVTDKKGRFITGLGRQSFGLLDNQLPPAAVIGFTQQTNLPLRIGVMIDTSSSIRTRFKFEQDAALDFFLQVLHGNDRAFIAGFDTVVAVTQDYTANIDALNTGIRKLRPGGGTALYDSLYRTCRDQMLTLRDDTSVRKAIILVSDGDDDWSRAPESDAIKMCQRAETIVYAISTDTSPTRGKGGEVLRTIADATGGRVFFPNRLEDVAQGFKSIEEELRSQYSLEYRPAEFKQDGSFRTIYLKAVDPKYHVNARTGYFAPRAEQ